MMPASMSPDRLPITSPSSGVRPMVVSTGRPPAIADAEAPLPRCSTIWFSDSRGEPRNSAARELTNWCDVPWKPYRRIRHCAATSRSIA